MSYKLLILFIILYLFDFIGFLLIPPLYLPLTKGEERPPEKGEALMPPPPAADEFCRSAVAASCLV